MMRWLNRLLSVSLGDIARATVFPREYANSKRRFVLIYFIRLCFLVGRRLWRDNCPRRSAALSFQTMLSILPLTIVVVAVAATFELGAYEQQLTNFLEANLLPHAATAISRQVLEMAKNIVPGTLGLVGGITLVLIAMSLLFSVEGIINDIFHCGRSRPLVRRVVTALVLLVGAPIAFAMSLYFTGNLLFLPKIVNMGLPLFFTILSLFLCYWLLPHTKISVGLSIVSAIIAGVIFEAVKIGFAFYVKYIGVTISYVYGAFAIIPLFMIWIYVAWMIFLFGAEFNAALHEVRHHERFDENTATGEA